MAILTSLTNILITLKHAFFFISEEKPYTSFDQNYKKLLDRDCIAYHQPDLSTYGTVNTSCF